jgi:hypothetical protein
MGVIVTEKEEQVDDRNHGKEIGRGLHKDQDRNDGNSANQDENLLHTTVGQKGRDKKDEKRKHRRKGETQQHQERKKTTNNTNPEEEFGTIEDVKRAKFCGGFRLIKTVAMIDQQTQQHQRK